MKILILGAAGRAGRATISCLKTLKGIERIFLADHNAEALTKLCNDLGHLPSSPRFLDAESERSLSERMAEADLVLGCLGPFHRYEGRIAKAAISAGRDYISLCDDPGAAEEAFSLDADARAKGVRALCGCGLTPGLSNLMSCRAASHLDRVDALELAWYLEAGPNIGMATLEHLLQAFGGKAACHKGGRERKVRAGSWEELVEFPPPLGWQAVYFLGHPEPATLPGAIGGVLDVWFKGGVGSRGRSLALQSLAWMEEGGKTDLWHTALRAAAGSIARRGEGSCLSALRVTAGGERGGAAGKTVLAVVGDYYRISGLVMAAAVDQWAGGGWPTGVYPPERVLGNRAFFAWLRRNGMRFLVGEDRPDLGMENAASMTA
jgi:hypothetical protein